MVDDEKCGAGMLRDVHIGKDGINSAVALGHRPLPFGGLIAARQEAASSIRPCHEPCGGRSIEKAYPPSAQDLEVTVEVAVVDPPQPKRSPRPTCRPLARSRALRRRRESW